MSEASSFENSGPATSTISVWDSQYVPAQEAFSIYRDTLNSVFMPWSAELNPDREFDARIEAVNFDQGLISKVQLKAPLEVSRNSRDIANSQLECFYACYVLSGALTVDQRGRENTANPGDLVLFNSADPVTVRSYGKYTDLTFLIPKSKLSAIRGTDDHFNNRVFVSKQMTEALSTCLRSLVESMTSPSTGVLGCLFDACVSLMPVQAGCFGAEEEAIKSRANFLVREIQKFVEQNIDNGQLSPNDAALKLGVSVRYVHKLFAANGTTFSGYVAEKRLERICRDLISPAGSRQAISTIAFRWGFNDMSTFIRAFKRQYGCAPRAYRSHNS